MGSRRLFYHPVGIFPMAARWYLASLAVLGLVFSAVHFVIHIRAQEDARQTVQAWMQKAEIQAAAVRYHLLRNALTLDSVVVRRGRSRLEIGQLLLRADAAGLTSGTPHLGEVRASGLHGSWHADDGIGIWAADDRLGRLWRAIGRLQLKDGSLELFFTGHGQPLKVEGINGWHELVDGQLRDQWSGLIGTASFELAYQQRHDRGQGHLLWRGLDFAALMQAMGRQAPAGSLQGDVRFEADWRDHRLLSASWQAVQYLTLADESQHRLEIRGENRWALGPSTRLAIKAEAWPLQPWSDALPDVAGYRLESARLTGNMDLKLGKERRLKASGLMLDALQLSAGTEPVGRIRSLRAEALELDLAKRRASLSSVRFSHGLLDVRPAVAATGADQLAWQWRADAVEVDDLALRLRLERGDIEIPSLSGAGSLDRIAGLELRLAHVGKTETADEEWRIQLSGRQQGRSWRQLQLGFHADRVPVSRLRAALPISGSDDIPLSMQGRASLDVQSAWEASGWHVTGAMHIADGDFRRAADRWRAAEINVSFDISPGAARMREFRASKWRYIAPLLPLQPEAAASLPMSMPAWWSTLLYRDHWGIDVLRLEDGEIALGRAEDVWVSKLLISSADLAVGRRSPFQAEGRIGDALLVVRGKWDLLRPQPRFELEGRFEAARPFFLNPWLAASGMPRLIRGRLSSDFRIEDIEGSHDTYRLAAKLSLMWPQVEIAANPDDPLIQRTGFSLRDTLARLQGKGTDIVLSFSLKGDWRSKPPVLAAIGESMEDALVRALASAGARQGSPAAPLVRTEQAVAEGRIRLHERAALSHNERARLRKLWRQLRRHSRWRLELRPVWTGEHLDEAQIRRIRFTQDLIEAFMRERGIGRARIFPIWPEAAEHGHDLGHVRVLLFAQGG